MDQLVYTTVSLLHNSLDKLANYDELSKSFLAHHFFISQETEILSNSLSIDSCRLINHVMKQGSATANTLGSITVIYSVFGTLLQFARGEDDELNTVLAGTASGLLYKSTAGLKKCAIGGAIGLTLSLAYCSLTMFTANKKNNYLYG